MALLISDMHDAIRSDRLRAGLSSVSVSSLLLNTDLCSSLQKERNDRSGFGLLDFF